MITSQSLIDVIKEVDMAKVKTGLSLTQEAYDALVEMASGPRGFGELVSILIVEEYERCKGRSSASVEERLMLLEKKVRALECRLGIEEKS